MIMGEPNSGLSVKRDRAIIPLYYFGGREFTNSLA
jgi:hypothetical protein